MTVREIREDLKEIRRYYEKEPLFRLYEKQVVPTAVLRKAERYNRAAGNAPALLYLTYALLYIEGMTQAALADEWGYTPDYIKQINNRLCAFLQEDLARGDR